MPSGVGRREGGQNAAGSGSGVEPPCCTTTRLSDDQAGLATEHTTRMGTLPSQGPREDPMTTQWPRDCDGHDGLAVSKATRRRDQARLWRVLYLFRRSVGHLVI